VIDVGNMWLEYLTELDKIEKLESLKAQAH